MYIRKILFTRFRVVPIAGVEESPQSTRDILPTLLFPPNYKAIRIFGP